MASSSAAMSSSVTVLAVAQNKKPIIASPFLKPLRLPSTSSLSGKVFSKKSVQVRASLKEKVVTGLTAAALTASMVVPDAAEAAVSPSLKNFLLSIVAGGVVLSAIAGAVIGVANFDPVKRS